jgi:hypothetical protein
MNRHLTPAVRRWIYGLALAARPLLLHFGLVEPEAAPLWLAFVVALLNVQDAPAEPAPVSDPADGDPWRY